MIVRYCAPEWDAQKIFWKIEILWKGENFHFLHILFASHKTTVIFLPFFYLCEEEQKQSARMEWQKMTGKFRKVASHYAPESAKGLFLNLPEGTSPLCSGPHRANVHWTLCAPLEPRHVNSVNIPAKCPTDIPTEHLLIDEDLSPLPLRSVQS